MACTRCSENRQAKLQREKHLKHNALVVDAEIRVIVNGAIAPFSQETHWSTDTHKLLIFIPEAFTPVCSTELGAMGRWQTEFEKLGCELILICTDPAERLLDWICSEPQLADASYKLFSSVVVPERLGLLKDGRSKRASVFVMTDGEVVKQEHFDKVGRSFAELHRMLYGYTTGSYCAEGWKGPEDGFLEAPA